MRLTFAVIAICASACAHSPTAYSETVRKTADGGTILLHPGNGTQDAARVALSEMAAHCRGQFEIVEYAKTGTGESVSYGSAGSTTRQAYGPGALTQTYAAGAGYSSAIYGAALTYLCRVPQDTGLNVSVTEFAFGGRPCTSGGDCMGLPCVATPGWDGKACGRADGTSALANSPRPTQGIGEKCDSGSPCPRNLSCKKLQDKDYGYCVGG